MRKRLTFAVALALIACCIFTLTACAQNTDKTVRLSTTTSVNDSGLMDYLVPYFKADTGYDLEISSAGTGAAINAAKYGNADVILVHSKAQEDAFVADGYSRKVEGQEAERIAFMYNFFVIVGPSADNADVASAETALAAFAQIAATQSKFISRGDNSGTHTKEVSLWHKDLGITAEDTAVLAGYQWYTRAGSGMGACLTMANSENAYVLTDKATFLSFKNDSAGDKLPNLKILYEQDNSLKNTYSMLAVNSAAPFTDAAGNALAEGSVAVNTAGADVFINWMLSEHAKALIAFYGTTGYGEALFTLSK